ncbi:DUF1642 domain-containing protein [Enterococcus avium]|uniref:DUF1642 domain-containing protein n=1 Tax=Enterococcus avium TaxID=33945 RepID=UPI002892648B|nr:DUF1642 domain-containing protein [Enterococcus avium]MDT2449023.1 DUF1642 domain-containing protein [Enterococcus avium]
MEKQDLIKEINKEKYDFSKPWTSLDRSDYKEGYNDACDDILDIIFKQLDELQKVKVPECVGELLDYYRKSADVDLLALLICFKDWYFRNDKTSESEEAIDWLVKHPEKFMKAWIDGYEVEEEPKYYVNIGDLYLKEPLGDTSDFTISMTWNREYAYPFDSWNMAREHASELGGTVEKV